MAKIRAPYLYTSTRLNLDQAHAQSTIQLSLHKDGSHDRRRHNDVQIGSDSSHFTRDHLSSESSLHFRSDERSPRSFLWRLLDDRKALEIQAVDLSQDQNQKNEAILTLLLRFPAAIRPFCIAFADHTEKDALNVFAITKDDELWTLTLQRDLFVHVKNTEALPLDWCRLSKPSMFAITTPYRLFSSTARELFVSMKDGSIVRLTRKVGEEGGRWHDAVYSERQWSSSFLKWRSGPTVKFGDMELEPTAAVAVTSTSFDEDDAHLITVCLNHNLRIWNLKTGRISAELDILGEEEQKYLIAANQRQLLQLVDMPGRQEQYVVTYSPKHHQFKFWAIFDAEAGRQGIREMRPGMEYKPPVEALMDTAVWNMEEFHLRPSRGTKQTELWIRVRSGQSSQVFMLNFDPFDFGHKLHEVSSEYVKACWEQDWVAVHPGRHTLEALDKISPLSSADADGELEAMEVPEITERWVSFLFYPGRFTVPLLETALQTYQIVSVPTITTTSREPLKDRVVKAVWSRAAKPGHGRQQSLDHDAKARWQTLYGIVRDLHKRASDAVSFAVDPHDQIPWLVTADSVRPIRECSELEKIEANTEIVHALPTPKLALYSFAPADDESTSEAIDDEDETIVGNLYYMAHTLRSLLPSSFQGTLKQVIREDLTSEPKPTYQRIQDLQNKSRLLEELHEEDNDKFDDVVSEFGGYQAFHTDVFNELLEKLEEIEKGRHQEEQITRYGAKLAIRIAQDTVALNTEVLLDLLATILYLEGSFEVEELATAIKTLPGDSAEMEIDDLSPAFDVEGLFTKIMNMLRENIILDFLTSNIRKERTKSRRRSTDASPMAPSSSEMAPVYASTLLQSIFVGDWKDVRAPEEDLSPTQLMTYHTRAWLTKLDIGQHESFTAHILADLIKHGDTSLAEQFLPWVPVTGWSSYLRGRLYLEKNEYDQASEWFGKAAGDMSKPKFNASSHDTADILLPDQLEKFANGLPAYYEHIISLLDKHKASLQTAGFAKLALEAHQKDVDKAKEQVERRNKPLDSKKSEALQKRTLDLLERLFTSSLATSDFDTAYTALTRMDEHPLRHFNVQSFIHTLVSQGQVKKLFSYPWSELADSVDKELDSRAKKTLSSGRGPEWHGILYAWRIRKGDYRGAAQVAFEKLERLRQEVKGAGGDPRDGRVVEAYLLLINTMAIIGEKDAWVLHEPVPGIMKLLGDGSGKEKRRLVTLGDVRREYAEELDRRAVLEQGRFGFVDERDGMDVL